MGSASGVVGGQRGVVGALAVGAPVPAVLAGVGVEDDDAAVAVAVGHVDLVGFGIHPDAGGAPQVRGVVAAAALAGAADLQQELAVLGELQDVGVAGRVPADPDVTLVVDVDAVLALGPLVAVAGTAPRPQDVALGVELDDRRRGDAAHPFLPALPGVEGQRPVEHPDVVVGVDVDARDLPEHPVVRQLARPERVDSELRDVPAGLSRLRLSGVGGAGGQHERHEHARNSGPVQ